MCNVNDLNYKFLVPVPPLLDKRRGNYPRAPPPLTTGLLMKNDQFLKSHDLVKSKFFLKLGYGNFLTDSVQMNRRDDK